MIAQTLFFSIALPRNINDQLPKYDTKWKWENFVQFAQQYRDKDGSFTFQEVIVWIYQEKFSCIPKHQSLQGIEKRYKDNLPKGFISFWDEVEQYGELLVHCCNRKL